MACQLAIMKWLTLIKYRYDVSWSLCYAMLIKFIKINTVVNFYTLLTFGFPFLKF